MEYYRAYDLTLRRFKIKASEVAKVSGLDESVVSRFRNDRQDLGAKTLKKLVDALSPAAKDYYEMLCKCKEDEAAHFSSIAA